MLLDCFYCFCLQLATVVFEYLGYELMVYQFSSAYTAVIAVVAIIEMINCGFLPFLTTNIGISLFYLK